MSKGRLGVIGCGQLSQMLGEAANRLGYSVAYLCVDETPVVEGLGSIYFPDQLDAFLACLLYTSPSPRDGLLSRMPSSA